MQNKVSSLVLVLLCVTALVIPCLSWLLSAFGLPVRSLLGEEGWRWLFAYGMDSMGGHWIILMIWVCTAVGSMRVSGLIRTDISSSRNGVIATGVVAVSYLSVLLLFAIHPHSPLLGITGTLYHSAFMWGLPCALCMGCMLCSIVYGIVSGHIHGLDDVFRLITYGVSHYSSWILCAMLLSFQWACLCFCFT